MKKFIGRKTRRVFRKMALEGTAPCIVGRRKRRRAFEGATTRRIRGRRRKSEKCVVIQRREK